MLKQLKIFNKTSLAFFLYLSGVIFGSNGQNVGIGTNQPKARLHIADSSVVFTGPNDLLLNNYPPISGSGMRFMWFSERAALRAGEAFGNEWDRDSIGIASIGLGEGTVARGIGSVALGSVTRAHGDFSFAVGENSKARGHGSISMGKSNEANGILSLAVGSFSKASGNYSTSIGLGLISKASGSVTLGAYNDTSDMPIASQAISSDRVFQIGNGSQDNLSNAMTILRNGNTGIGTLTPAGFFHIKGNSYPTPTLILEENENDYTRMQFKNTTVGRFWEIGAKPSTTNSAASFEIWHAGGLNNIFTIRGDGNATLLGSLTQASDARLKKNIQQLSPVLQKLDHLKAYTYQWNNEVMDQQQQIGLLAQEVEKVFPMLVKTDEKGTKSVNYISLIPVLLSAIQELQQKVNILEQKKLD